MVSRRALSAALLTLMVGSLLGVAQQPAAAEDYVSAPTNPWSPNGTVYAMAVTSTTVFIGGDFDTLTGPGGQTQTRRDLAAFSRSTGAPLPWNPTVSPATNGVVRALAVDGDGTVFTGGYVETDENDDEDVVKVGWLAAVGAGGERKFDVEVNRQVLDLTLSGDDLYVGGNFSRIGPSSNPLMQNFVARLDAGTGAPDRTWNPIVTGGSVQSVALYGTSAFLGGNFVTLGGQPRPFLGAVSTTNGTVTGWVADNAGFNPQRVRDVAVYGDLVLAAIGGYKGRAGAWSRTTGANRWLHGTDGEVQAVAAYDGVAYYGGHFGNYRNQPREQLAAITTATGALRSYALNTATPLIPGIWALKPASDGLRIGGSTLLTGYAPRRYLHLRVKPATPVVAKTRVTVQTVGCPTCRVRLVQDRPGAAAYATPWKRAVGAKATFDVVTARTVGMSIQVEAPWERRMKTRTSEVVMRYKKMAAGRAVTAKVAKTKKAGSPCYAGTSARAVTFSLRVQKATLKQRKRGDVIGSRAFSRTARSSRAPMKPAKQGALTAAGITVCS